MIGLKIEVFLENKGSFFNDVFTDNSDDADNDGIMERIYDFVRYQDLSRKYLLTLQFLPHMLVLATCYSYHSFGNLINIPINLSEHRNIVQGRLGKNFSKMRKRMESNFLKANL
jgi:hypothetical protein